MMFVREIEPKRRQRDPTVFHGPTIRSFLSFLERRHRKPIEHTSQRVLGEDDLAIILPDLVVAAGGDGTVSAVARLLAGRGTPLAILPTETANNIARCVGTDALEVLP